MVVGRISTVTGFDYGECARAAVDGFLSVYGKTQATQIISARNESAGA